MYQNLGESEKNKQTLNERLDPNARLSSVNHAGYYMPPSKWEYFEPNNHYNSARLFNVADSSENQVAKRPYQTIQETEQRIARHHDGKRSCSVGSNICTNASKLHDGYTEDYSYNSLESTQDPSSVLVENSSYSPDSFSTLEPADNSEVYQRHMLMHTELPLQALPMHHSAAMHHGMHLPMHNSLPALTHCSNRAIQLPPANQSLPQQRFLAATRTNQMPQVPPYLHQLELQNAGYYPNERERAQVAPPTTHRHSLPPAMSFKNPITENRANFEIHFPNSLASTYQAKPIDQSRPPYTNSRRNSYDEEQYFSEGNPFVGTRGPMRGQRSGNPQNMYDDRPFDQGELKSQRGCTCKKSRCLKLYCECFAIGATCGPLCKCDGCGNTHNNQQERQKALQSSKDKSTAVKGRCNCKRSGCLKKYCDCYKIGQFCNDECGCKTCQNRPGHVEKADYEESILKASQVELAINNDTKRTYSASLQSGKRNTSLLENERATPNRYDPLYEQSNHKFYRDAICLPRCESVDRDMPYFEPAVASPCAPYLSSDMIVWDSNSKDWWPPQENGRVDEYEIPPYSSEFSPPDVVPKSHSTHVSCSGPLEVHTKLEEMYENSSGEPQYKEDPDKANDSYSSLRMHQVMSSQGGYNMDPMYSTQSQSSSVFHPQQSSQRNNNPSQFNQSRYFSSANLY
eukprot:Platyproteum_vivax@DN5448_c0_g1_i1.p1